MKTLTETQKHTQKAACINVEVRKQITYKGDENSNDSAIQNIPTAILRHSEYKCKFRNF